MILKLISLIRFTYTLWYVSHIACDWCDDYDSLENEDVEFKIDGCVNECVKEMVVWAIAECVIFSIGLSMLTYFKHVVHFKKYSSTFITACNAIIFSSILLFDFASIIFILMDQIEVDYTIPKSTILPSVHAFWNRLFDGDYNVLVSKYI